MRKYIRIKDRKRFIVFISMLLTVIYLCILTPVLCFDNFNNNKLKNIKYIELTVQEGQTLWEISKNFINDSVDIRDYIEVIKKINNISDLSYIIPGQKIKFINLNDFKKVY